MSTPGKATEDSIGWPVTVQASRRAKHVRVCRTHKGRDDRREGVRDKIAGNMREQYEKSHIIKDRSFEPGDTVWYKDHNKKHRTIR